VRSRLLIGGTATLLAASAVSIAGLIGFVGLLVPHSMRFLLKSNDYRLLIPLSAVGVASQVGYKSLGSFSSAFKAEFGVSPKQYQKQSSL